MAGRAMALFPMQREQGALPRQAERLGATRALS
jgi:hypothetical protein